MAITYLYSPAGSVPSVAPALAGPAFAESAQVQVVDAPDRLAEIEPGMDLLVAIDPGEFPDRCRFIEGVAEAVARGVDVAVIASEAEARGWLSLAAHDGIAGARPLNRVNIAGMSGSGKTTLARRLGPLGLPIVSLDHELWWKEGRRPRTNRGRMQLVERIARGERWLAEGPYPRASIELSRHADLTICLLLPTQVARQRRDDRGGRGIPLRARLFLAIRRRLRRRPPIDLQPALSELAHRAPVLRLYSDGEVDALVRGLFRGAGVLVDATP